MGMGLYFAFFRPPLLPEDVRSLGVSLPTLQAQVPRLLTWLTRIFWVMGGYIFTSGLLLLFIAVTSFRKRARGTAGVVTLAGLTSLGWMTMVNFLIDSDFKWLLLLFALLWGLALVFSWLGK
jgi:hypothetical protein